MHRLTIPDLKHLEPQCFRPDFCRFRSICIHRWYLGTRTQVSTRLICFTYTLDISPEGNFIQYFWCTYILTTIYPKRSGMEFSSRAVVVARKKFQSPSDFQVRDAQPVVQLWKHAEIWKHEAWNNEDNSKNYRKNKTVRWLENIIFHIN